MGVAALLCANFGRGRFIGSASALAVAVLFTASACVPDDDADSTDESLSVVLDTDRPCEFLDFEDAASILFGDSPTVGPSERVERSLLGCDDGLALEVEGQEVGAIDAVIRIFTKDQVGEDVGSASYDRIDGFRLSGQQESNEILDHSVEPIASDWDDGEVYVLDGLFRNRDLYIVGFWGESADFAVGLSFRINAEQEYFDQPLTHFEYCDRTDLATDCLISSQALLEWLTDEYLPAVLDRLSAAVAD